MKRPILIVIIAVAGAAVLAAGWYLGSPLFIDRTVSEAFPVELPSADDMDDMPAAEIEAKRREALANLPQGEAWEDLSGRAQQEIQDRVMDFAAAMPDSDMDDAMPGGASPERLAQGTFMDADRFHKGSGKALIYRLADGGLLLRFEEFRVTNGPDLHVLLAENAEPKRRDELGDYIDLGSLKGNVGSQNYMLDAAPTSAGTAAWSSTACRSTWCSRPRRFPPSSAPGSRSRGSAFLAHPLLWLRGLSDCRSRASPTDRVAEDLADLPSGALTQRARSSKSTAASTSPASRPRRAQAAATLRPWSTNAACTSAVGTARPSIAGCPSATHGSITTRPSVPHGYQRSADPVPSSKSMLPAMSRMSSAATHRPSESSLRRASP